ncbi:MAG: RING finger protein [Candidatus Hermodarchaeota archaeon]
MKTSFEDIFFYLDLTKDILKKKELIKAIKYYISEKNKSNLKGHYGLLIFQEEGNPIFIIDKKDSNIIANTIEENWRTRPKKKSYFENGLFYIFSYIAETTRKKSKINRIIVITDTPSDLSEDYTDALFNLVSNIKNLPTFIDIIRISVKSERFFKDDVKLNILTRDTKGGIYYLHDKKDFMNIVEKLVQPKQLIEGQEVKIKINKEDYYFYSHLAKKLKQTKGETGIKCYICHEEICPFCTNIYDIPLMCENCGSGFHNCCITNYTIQHNIGIPHIFRCPNCDILLKIRQEDIVKLEDDKIKTVDEYIKTRDIKKITETTKIQEDFLDESQDQGLELLAPPKTVRIGGFFGKVYTVRKEGDKLIYQKISQNSNQDKRKKTKETLNLSLNNQNLEKDENEGTYMICPECRTKLTKTMVRINSCPYCGHKFST